MAAIRGCRGVPYGGGKSSMLPHILPLTESAGNYSSYIEPFCGGASVFFGLPAKKSSKLYVINDKFELLVNFYKVAKTRPCELIGRLDSVPYARSEHSKARHLIGSDDDLDRAAGFLVLSQMNYAHELRSGWGHEIKSSTRPLSWKNLKSRLPLICAALDIVQIESIDAIDCIEKYDHDGAFFYIDPPYPSAQQGYEHKFDADDFLKLIEKLEKIKGRFILSCYPTCIDIKIIQKNRWKYKTIKFKKRIGNASSRGEKTEMLIWNFDPADDLFLDCSTHDE